LLEGMWWSHYCNYISEGNELSGLWRKGYVDSIPVKQAGIFESSKLQVNKYRKYLIVV